MKEKFPDAEIITDIDSGINFKRKGKFHFRSRKEPEQSCYIPITIKNISDVYMKFKQKRFSSFNPTYWFYVVLVCFWMLPSVALSENRVEAERQNWEVFTSRN